MAQVALSLQPAAVPVEVDPPPALDKAFWNRTFRRLGDLGYGLCLSALLHLSLLMALGVWKLLAAPVATGFVIQSTLVTGDDGAEPLQINTILHVADLRDGDDRPQGGGDGQRDDAAAVRLLDFALGASAGELTVGDFGTHGDGARGGGTGFFGTKLVGNSFVFVVDCSGSMVNNGRFARAQVELSRAILELGAGQEFHVILYNQGAIPLFDPEPSPAELIEASRENRARARDWIRSRAAGGDTLPEAALRMALAMRPDVVFFLTDGEIPRNTRTVAHEANRHRAVIHTTAFQSRQGEVLLKGIAQDSGGTYRYIP